MEAILQVLRDMVPNEDFEIVSIQEVGEHAVCTVRYLTLHKVLFVTVFFDVTDGLLSLSAIDTTDISPELMPRACLFLSQAPNDLMGNTIGKVYVYIDDDRLNIGYTWGMELSPELSEAKIISAILSGQLSRFATDITFIKITLKEALSRKLQ